MSLLARFRLAKMCWKLAKELEPVVQARTRQLMGDLNPLPHSGEWKRHQVYSQLVKEFPQFSRKSIALTIEVTKCCG
jgi:hypothetical protein